MSKSKRAILALIVANIIWGAGAPIFKWTLTSIHPFTLALFRFAIPMILLGFFIKKKPTIRAQDIPDIFLAGLLAITINISFFFLGLEQTQSINAPIISSSAPVFLLFFSLLFLREKLRLKTLLGNLLGLSGVLLIVIQPLLRHASATGSIVGNVFFILSMLGGVTGAIFSKKIVTRYDPMIATYYTFLIGTLTFLPLSFKEVMTYGFFQQLTLQSITGIVFGSIFSSFIAYYCFFWGIKHMQVSTTSAFSYVDPIAAIVIAVPVLHEYPNSVFLLGAFLVLFGIFIAEGRLHYHPLHRLFVKS